MSTKKPRKKSTRPAPEASDSGTTTSIGTRLEEDYITRMSKCAETMSKKMGTTIRMSNILQICVTNHLPNIEQQFGITPPPATPNKS